MIIELDESDSESVTVYLKTQNKRSASSISIKDAKITLRVLDRNSKEYTINCNPKVGRTIVTPEIYEAFKDEFYLEAKDIGIGSIKITEKDGVIEVPCLKELVDEVGTLKGYFFVEHSEGWCISIPSGTEYMVIKEAEKYGEQK